MERNIQLLADPLRLLSVFVRLAEAELVGRVPVLHEHADHLVALPLQKNGGH